MIKLKMFVRALASTLVLYHDSQVEPSKKLIAEADESLLMKQSDDYALRILEDENIPFEKRFNQLSDEYTKSYPDRKPFLEFILSEIVYFKDLADRTEPLSTKELKTYTDELVRVFTIFQKLLTTMKSHDPKNQVRVKFSTKADEPVKEELIAGLKNNALIGSVLCRTGYLIQDVLNLFHFKANTPEEDILVYATKVMNEFHHPLLIKKLTAQVQELETSLSASTQAMRIQELETTLAMQAKELEKAQAEIGRLKDQHEVDTKTITILQAVSMPAAVVDVARQPFSGLGFRSLGVFGGYPGARQNLTSARAPTATDAPGTTQAPGQ